MIFRVNLNFLSPQSVVNTSACLGIGTVLLVRPGLVHFVHTGNRWLACVMRGTLPVYASHVPEDDLRLDPELKKALDRGMVTSRTEYAAGFIA